jgi:hypothetical protein
VKATEIKVLNTWIPDLRKSIDDLMIDWYMEVTSHFELLIQAGTINTEIIRLDRRDDKYNRIIFTKDIIFEIRPPYEDLPNLPGRYWHDDGDMHFYTISWTNVEPTLIRSKEEKINFISEPYEVVMISNRTHEHRAPDAKNPNRFYARALVEKEIGEFLAS